LLNNYNPGYFGNGSVDTTDTFAIPPTKQRSIGDVLLEGQVSFRWYGEGFAQYAANPSDPANVYCNICNGFQYQTSIMANAAVRDEVLRDASNLYDDLRTGILPAVSFVKPGGINDGHPTSSKWNLFEDFTKKVLYELKRNPRLWRTTAVFITVDEGGGYWDSGYIQPLDFFGDGPRIPLIAVSPYARGGRIVHSYNDHASIVKFIERNWGLKPLTDRSRDNLPNPKMQDDNPYVPRNMPAVGDLFDMFDFDDRDHDHDHD
jgi:phospholipase C